MRDGSQSPIIPSAGKLPPPRNRRRSGGRWAMAGIVASLAVVLALVMHLPQEIVELSQNRARIRELQEETNNLRKRRDERLERLRNLRENYAEQELEIRRNLHLYKPGDSVYILPPKSNSEPTPPVPATPSSPAN